MKFNRRVILAAVAALMVAGAPVAAHRGGGPGGQGGLGRRRNCGGDGVPVASMFLTRAP